MKLLLLSEATLREARNDKDFTYRDLSETMWRKKHTDECDRTGIDFDLENDDAVASRRLSFPAKIGDIDDPAVFICELRSAGGDWEDSSHYFRCQLIKGSARRDGEDLSCSGRDDGPYFCFIPNKEEGNHHLLDRGEGKWGAPDQDEATSKGTENEKSDRKCWAALKTHLEKLVNDAQRKPKRL